MTNIAGAVFMPQAMRRFTEDYASAIKPYIERLQRIVMDNASLTRVVDGVSTTTIPPYNAQTVLQQCGDTIQRFFVGQDMRSSYAADGVTPLAPFPEILNKWLAWMTVKIVQKHADSIKKRLPQDVQQWLANRLNHEMFIQNPLAYYDASHTWVDPRGYVLSQRIWNSSIDMRRRIDALISEGIRTGRSALDMSRDLEAFLTPYGALKRTNKPYGTNASYHALTLGRTEIAYAHTNATRAAAYANPLVDGWDWALSASHPKFDVCDGYATIDMSGKRVKDPYPLDGSEPMVVRDSHPNCICNNRTVISQNIDDIIAKLRDDMRNNRPAPVSPIDTLSFVRLLMGAYLAAIGWREAQDAA